MKSKKLIQKVDASVSREQLLEANISFPPPPPVIEWGREQVIK